MAPMAGVDHGRELTSACTFIEPYRRIFGVITPRLGGVNAFGGWRVVPIKALEEVRAASNGPTIAS
jgi:hypothetical protein